MFPLEKILNYEEFLEVDKISNENLEFIDGKIYLLSAPSVNHQKVVTNLSAEFRNYFKGKACMHFVAPFDVVLKIKDKTHKVQPDLTVICDKNGLNEQNYDGVPELVVGIGVDFVIEADSIINAADLKPNKSLFDGISVKEKYAIGDCNEPYNIALAIRAGNDVGRAL